MYLLKWTISQFGVHCLSSEQEARLCVAVEWKRLGLQRTAESTEHRTTCIFTVWIRLKRAAIIVDVSGISQPSVSLSVFRCAVFACVEVWTNHVKLRRRLRVEPCAV